MKKRLYFFPAVILLLNFFLSAEELPLPEEEAPLSIFSYQLGDDNVDLFLSGSWESSVMGGFGFSWNSDDSGMHRNPFPGFSDGLIFSQSTDLTISLWLADKYFFETSIIDDYNLNTILFGYDAPDENSFLQKVRIGNTDLGTVDYSLLSIPEASNDSLGFTAEMKGDRSEHCFTVRFDPAEKAARSFRGSYSIEETRIKLTDYIKGMFFILPDDNVENLTVYVEDGPGTYRTATADEVVVSEKDGYVFFREPQDRKVAVHYTKNGVSVGDDTLGQGALAAETSTGEIDISGTEQFRFSMGTYLGIDMSALETDIDGNTSLLIYQPGVFSPFQLLSVYYVPFETEKEKGRPAEAFLADTGLYTGDTIPFSPGLTGKSVMFTREDTDSIRSPASRYPFADKVDPESVIYGRNTSLYGTPPGKEILIDRYIPAGTYNLGDNVLEGSVEMLVNGRKDNRFTFDPVTGNVTLLFRPSDNDRIDFLYRSRSAASTGGDLVIGTGSRVRFSENLSAEIGAGLRWNISEGRYTENAGEAPGSLLLSAGMNYKKNGLEFNLDTGISFFNPDTTGIFRLDGMNKGGIPLPVTYSMLYPSAAPSSGPSLLSSSRGKLYYKDYHLYTNTGKSILMDYDWDIPQDQIYGYDDGGRSGPYIAGTDDEIDGSAAVFDYDLSAGQWAGGRIPVVLGREGLDLSETSTITLKMKLTGASGTVDIYIRAGRLAEDLDSDGVLDCETADFERGFEFNPADPAGGTSDLSMKVGGSFDGKSGNGQIDTEDLNNNGFLGGESQDTLVSFYTTNDPNVTSGTDFDFPSGAWQTVTLRLTPGERSRLHNVTAFEIIINEAAAGTASGKLLVGDISFNGSSFVISPASGQEVTGDEISESLSGEPGNSLAEEFPEVRDIFSITDDSQKTGRFSWTGTGTWSAETNTSPANLRDYNKISFYIKFTALPDLVTFSAENPSGNGISFSFAPSVQTGNWHKCTFDYSSDTLTVDGIKTAVSVLESDSSAEDVQTIRITADCTGASAGTVFIDEIHLEDPVYGIDTGAVSSYSYTKKGTVLSVRGREIISDLTFSGQTRAAGNNFAAGFSASRGSDLYTYGELSFLLMGIGIEGNLNVTGENSHVYFSPGYTVLIPAGKARIEDSFSRIDGSNILNVTKSDRIYIPYGDFLASGGFTADYSDDYLLQSWNISVRKSNRPYTADTKAEFTMVNSANPFDGLSLPETVAESYRLAVPYESENEDRKTSFTTNHALKTEKASFEVTEIFSTSAEGTSDRKMNHEQTISISTPFTVKEGTPGQLTIKPSYTRSVYVSNGPDKDDSFITDISQAAGDLASQKYYFLSLPVYELWAPRSSGFTEYASEVDTAVYTPSAEISVSRKTGNTVKDLFIPSKASLSVKNIMKKEWNTETDLKTVSFQTSSSAYNLFGVLGSSPRYSWYQTEEVSGRTGITASFPSDNDVSVKLSQTRYVNFIISKNKSLDVESNLSFSWTDFKSSGSIISSYIRKRPLEKAVKFPVIDPEGKETSFIRYKEEFSFKYDYTDEKSETSIDFTLHHTTDLLIGEKGIVSFTAGIGIIRKSVDVDTEILRTYTAGIEGGISAKLIF